MTAADPIQPRINMLIAKLKSGDVQRIEIVQTPPRVLTRTKMTPEMLEQGFYHKLIIRDIRSETYEADLIAAVISVSASASAQMGDLRWGVSFFDHNERRIESLYFDASGRRGAVDSLPVTFRGDLFRWLNDNLSQAFR